jgi:hypothetical protein
VSSVVVPMRRREFDAIVLGAGSSEVLLKLLKVCGL